MAYRGLTTGRNEEAELGGQQRDKNFLWGSSARAEKKFWGSDHPFSEPMEALGMELRTPIVDPKSALTYHKQDFS